MTMHPNTTLTTAVLTLVVVLVNIAMAYFNITGQISCDLTAANPAMQAAAAAAVGR